MDYAYGTPGTEAGEDWSGYFEAEQDIRAAEEREAESKRREAEMRVRGISFSRSTVQPYLSLLGRYGLTEEDVYKYITEYYDNATSYWNGVITTWNDELIKNIQAWKAMQRRRHALALITPRPEAPVAEAAAPKECSIVNKFTGAIKKTKNSCTVMGGKRSKKLTKRRRHRRATHRHRR